MGNLFSLCESNRIKNSSTNVKISKKNEILSLSLLKSNNKTKNDDWYIYFVSECSQLKKKCSWCQKLQAKLKLFRSGMNRDYYLNTIIGLYNNQFPNNLLEASTTSLPIMLNSSYKQEALQYYKLIMGQIEIHLSKENESVHPLSYLQSLFFEQFYVESLESIVKINARIISGVEAEKIGRKLIESLQQFIRVFTETLRKYYEFKIIAGDYENTLFSNDNVLNFTTSLLFNNDKVRETIDYFLRFSEKSFEQIILLSKNLQAIDFLIPSSLSLDKNSITFYQDDDTSLDKSLKRRLNSSSSPTKVQNIKKNSIDSGKNDLSFYSCYKDESYYSAQQSMKDNFGQPTMPMIGRKESLESFYSAKREIIAGSDLHNSFDDNRQFTMEITSFKGNKTDKFNELFGDFVNDKNKNEEFHSNHDLFETNSYIKSILILKQIEKAKTPLQKMKKILSTVDQIISDINEFYEKHSVSEEKKLKFLDSEDFFCIIVYVIVKSEVIHLKINLKLIEKFMTNTILNSFSGYYFALFQLAVQFLEKIELKNNDEFKEKLRESLTNQLILMKSNKTKRK